MSPRVLRATCRVGLADMAVRLHLTVGDLRALEATPTGLWEVSVLEEYARLLGYRLVLRLIRDGAELAT